MESGVERPAVRRAIESGGGSRAMENGRPEVRRAMENGGKRRPMENLGERKLIEYWNGMMEELESMQLVASEVVMCSTCSGFMIRKKRIADPDEEVVEVVREAEKMRDLMRAMLLHGPLQEMEPVEATKEQWQVLRRRRMIMMETKRCPACSRSLPEMCPTCSRSLSEKPKLVVEDKAVVADPRSKAGSEDLKKGSSEDKTVVADPGSKAGSKDLKKGSSEEGSELMDVLPSQGGKKKITMEYEAAAVDARSVKKSKRSTEYSDGSSSGLKKKRKKKVKGSGSEKKFRGSEEVKKLASGNGKTKMVTMMFDKESLDILMDQPPVKPIIYPTYDSLIQIEDAKSIARYEVDSEFHEYLRRQSIIRGYAEYQLEVSDGEEE